MRQDMMRPELHVMRVVAGQHFSLGGDGVRPRCYGWFVR